MTDKPAYGNPEVLDNGDGAHDDIHWSLSWGFALNFDHADPGDATSPLRFLASFSGTEQELGITAVEVTPDQLDRLALLLIAKAARVRQESTQ